MAKGDYIQITCDCGKSFKIKGTKLEYYCPKCGEPFMDVFPRVGNYERDKERKAKWKALEEAKKAKLNYIMTGRR